MALYLDFNAPRMNTDVEVRDLACGTGFTHPTACPSSYTAYAKLQDNMGKVHGSLARAGKVKSQTPKVEKQEKKKTPKGRAKKRILYNRRFVNVTTLPGGKRRMNPNPEK
ncbi:hypothetical protein AX16_004931 [Volvariella volvacea WC 439]|nr:hypothetical protein AX16_004931 [Volvariella volvacea WC 439]